MNPSSTTRLPSSARNWAGTWSIEPLFWSKTKFPIALRSTSA